MKQERLSLTERMQRIRKTNTVITSTSIERSQQTALRAVPSHSGEPIVSAILPKSAREAVGHEYRRDPLRILEPELGRNAKLERIAVARRQDLVGNLEGEKRLRVQRRGHVDAGVISVGALEADVFRRQVRADALQEGPQRDAGPFADHAPAFDANVARHLRFLRQLIKLW